MTARTRQGGQKSWEQESGARQFGQTGRSDSWDRTTRTGQQEQGNRNRTAREEGWPDHDSKESAAGTGTSVTSQPGQSRENIRTAMT